MEWDLDLYDTETNQQCIVNTSDLNEELGQVSDNINYYRNIYHDLILLLNKFTGGNTFFG